ncbi:hypothetical protein Tco_0059494 [Tanacetum coccineum]
MDDPNITIEEYIRLEEEKACRRGKVYNWETATYGKIWDSEDVHGLGSVETEFPAIVFNDTLTFEVALSCEPEISSLNNDEIEYIISFDESDDEDCIVIFDKNSLSYKIISVNNLKTDLENDNDKVNMPLLPSPEPTDNDDNKVDIEHSSGDLSVKPLPNVINTNVGAYAHGSNKLLETSKLTTLLHIVGIKRLLDDLGVTVAQVSVTAAKQKALRNQDYKNKESTRRTMHVETSTSIALVSCDGLGGKAKKSVSLMMEKQFRMELELILVPQPSDPTNNVVDEAVHKELGDSLVRVVTTASSLEAEQDSGNITKTRSKATPNESSSLGTTSCGGPRGNTLQSDEDGLKLNELIELCTTLQKKVLDLEKTKTTQQIEIDSLKRRIKKLEKKKVKNSLAKEGRRINAIDVDDDITLVNVQDDADNEMFDADALNELTLAQALEALKTSKPKVKRIAFQEPGKSTTTTTTTIVSSQQQSKDKGKRILVEPEKPMKKKDQISFVEETAKRLQAEFDEEEKLAKEKDEKEQEANITLIETWNDIQANIDADHQLAERLQAQEQ